MPKPDRKKKTPRGKRASDWEALPPLNPNAAGIDVGNAEHYVAVPAGRDAEPVQKFGSFTADLHRIAEWLKVCGIQTVVMQATGVYWIALYQILEDHGFEVNVVNAHHTKTLPGRKTDVLECQWLQKLHTFGLLNNSFQPAEEIWVLRTCLIARHLVKIVEVIQTFGSTDKQGASASIGERRPQHLGPRFRGHRCVFIENHEVETLAAEGVEVIGATQRNRACRPQKNMIPARRRPAGGPARRCRI